MDYFIYEPQLPPKAGYIEIELDGKRVYQKIYTEDERTLLTLEEENKLLRAQISAQTERADFLEDCVAEMAAVIYV